MNNYLEEQVADLSVHQFHFIKVRSSNHSLRITLNRPARKNALHPQMINEIAFSLHHAHFNHSIWTIIMDAEGDVFCAGADLKAMLGEVEPHHSSIPTPGRKILLGEIFNEVHKPIIGLIQGNAMAGAMLIVAGCDYVISDIAVNFSLPEVKRGLWPFQVMQSLAPIVPKRLLLDWCIRGSSITAAEGKEIGLVSHLVKSEDQEVYVQSLTAQIHEGSPNAIKNGLKAWNHITSQENHHEYLADMLRKQIESDDAIEGIKAFKEKRKPNWNLD